MDVNKNFDHSVSVIFNDLWTSNIEEKGIPMECKTDSGNHDNGLQFDNYGKRLVKYKNKTLLTCSKNMRRLREKKISDFIFFD